MKNVYGSQKQNQRRPKNQLDRMANTMDSGLQPIPSRNNRRHPNNRRIHMESHSSKSLKSNNPKQRHPKPNKPTKNLIRTRRRRKTPPKRDTRKPAKNP